MNAILKLSASESGVIAIDADARDHVAVEAAVAVPASNIVFPLVGAFATIVHLTRDRLVRSKMNVRQRDADVTELAALIRSQGLLQNLIGYKQLRDGVATGMVEIVAGGRRLAALDLLMADQELPEEFEIPVLLVSEHEAIDISLAENSGREAMHPADVFDAMLAMSGASRTAEDIGIAFGIEPLRVKRRLKLAKVSARLLNLYREDKANIDQMSALALVDSHAKQEQVWDALPEYQRSAANLRRLLTQEHIDVKNDGVAKFVGVAAYEKAGGVMLRDLFSDHDEGYMQDVPLLEQLAATQLDAYIREVSAEGDHAWVEARLRLGFEELSAFGHAPTLRITPSEEQQIELDRLQAELVVLEDQRCDAQENDDDEYLAALDEKCVRAEQRLRAMMDSLVQPDPAAAALAGVIVAITRDGKVQVHRNLIRPSDKQSLKAAVTLQKGDGAVARAVHSERLVKMLTSHRTMALAAEMMQQPNVALAVLTNELILSAIGTYSHEALAKIRADRPSLAEEVKGTPAHLAIEAKREEVAAMLNSQNEGQSQLAWCLAQPQETLMGLMAFCVACTVDAVQGREALSPNFKHVADAVGLDMRKWWAASTENYFDHVSKARAIDVVTEAVSPVAAAPMSKMKKEDVAGTAARAVAVSQWLHDVLHTAASLDPAS